MKSHKKSDSLGNPSAGDMAGKAMDKKTDAMVNETTEKSVGQTPSCFAHDRSSNVSNTSLGEVPETLSKTLPDTLVSKGPNSRPSTLPNSLPNALSGNAPSKLPCDLPANLPDNLPDNLPGLRELIDSVDKSLVSLLHQRAQISLAVGAIKKQTNLPVWQPQREEELLKKIQAHAGEALPAEHVTAIYKEILSSSRALQKEETVGYLGPEGTFSHLASRHIFGQSTKAVPFGTIAQLVAGLQKGQCDYAVIPIENSLYGTVSESFDQLLQHSSVQIIGEHIERIRLAALSLESSLRPAPSEAVPASGEITKVFSHPQPLGQCAQWIQATLPHAQVIPVESTSAAAHKASVTQHSIAIGHEKMGELNNLPLHVLATDIEDSPNNWTRFFILQAHTRQDLSTASSEGSHVSTTPSHPSANKSTLAFYVADKPGSLAHVLTVFAKAKANLSKLESRPSRMGTWKYVFFADLNCNVRDIHYAPMLEELGNYCHDMRILGVYNASAHEVETATNKE